MPPIFATNQRCTGDWGGWAEAGSWCWRFLFVWMVVSLKWFVLLLCFFLFFKSTFCPKKYPCIRYQPCRNLWRGQVTSQRTRQEWRPCMEQRVLHQVFEGQKLFFQQKFVLASHHSSFIIFSRISRITHDSSLISHYSFITCHFLSRWWFHFFWFSPLFGEDFPFDQYFSDGLVQPPTSSLRMSWMLNRSNRQGPEHHT